MVIRSQEAIMFTRILVPTDFSEPSDAALEYGRIVAAKFSAALHLLHVVETPAIVSPEAYIGESPDIQTALIEDAQQRLAALVTPSDRARFTTTTEVLCGAGARAIVEYARQQNVDLIVMGTHGRSGVAHLLMGSVAEKVLRAAPCPVLTVRTRPIPAKVVAATAARVAAPA
jgi:nucleotide-binding universal stress UspA family protein